MLRRATIALLLFPSALALAQPPAGTGPDRGPPPAKNGDSQRGPERGPPPDLVQLTQDLKLDSTQSSAFLRLMRERHEKMMALRDASDSQRREIDMESDRQIASLMNATQFQQVQAWMQAHRPPHGGQPPQR